MLIHTPTMEIKGHRCRVQVKVDVHPAAPVSLPDTLWFNLPASVADGLDLDNATPFLLALLLPAMYLNQPLHTPGWYSEELSESLPVVQTIFSGWSNMLKPVPILAGKGVRAMKRVNEGMVGSCFSAGVDSFYTLRQYLHHPSPAFRISHALFALIGPPFHHSLPQPYEEAVQRMSPMLQKLGVTLLDIRSNVYDFCHPLQLSWTMVHGLITAATIHFMGHSFQKFFIPSSYSFHNLFPWGSHPLTDPLLSTEITRIIHHAFHLPRTEKTVAIADWPPIWQHLNVCLYRPEGTLNCGQCSKCIRTILTLACTPHLGQFKTFPLQNNSLGETTLAIAPEQWQNLIKDEHSASFFQEVLHLAQTSNHSQVAQWVTMLLERYRCLING
ncbi:MAG: hypothetical protein G8345_02700 [Magnetococcales bacterium]|nr:hypothetical protein [Magnetococcales bacterium]NGZ25781.1 hypothetical protein [Magnetococcales bacterium]